MSMQGGTGSDDCRTIVLTDKNHTIRMSMEETPSYVTRFICIFTGFWGGGKRKRYNTFLTFKKLCTVFKRI